MSHHQSMKVESPYDGSLIKEIKMHSASEVETALSEAHQLAESGSRLPGHERIAILERLAELMEDQKEAIAYGSAQEGGKPLIDSRVEVARAIEGVKIAIHTMWSLAGREVPMDLTPSSVGRLSFTHSSPCGTIAAISAFNHPTNLIIHQVIPAVAVGSPVIIKPAETTPLSCFRIMELLYQAGLPEAWAKAVLCDIPTAERMVTDPRIDFFSFIGSAKVGWYLRSKLAPGVRCTLEHGGSAPVIVEPDADIAKTIPLLAKGGFYHAGQVCVSVQRVFCHKSRIADFISAMKQEVSKLVVGDPCDDQSTVGPLILPREADRVEKWVREAEQSGAQVVCGGRRLSNSCFEPTILLNPPETTQVSKAEVFGPVVCVYEYEDLEEAISKANRPNFSFQAAIFTRDVTKALKTARKLRARTVLINDHTAFRVDWMPFGGGRDSGIGTGGIPYTMKELCEEKQIVFNLN